MKKIMSLCMVLVLIVSIYLLVLADAGVKNFELENENDKGSHKVK